MSVNTSQSIIEAVFNNSTQFTLQSPKTDPQRYFEFINLNEQTPSFNRDFIKEQTTPKIQINQNYQVPQEQATIKTTGSPTNQTYFTQINLYSKNENMQGDQGYIVQVSKNNRLDLLPETGKIQKSPKIISIDILQKTQKENQLQPQTYQNAFKKKSLQLDIPSIQQSQQQNFESQEIHKKLKSNFNQKCQSARTSPQRFQQQQQQQSNVQQGIKQLQSHKDRQMEYFQNLTDRISNSSSTTKSFTQQKLDSLRSSQNRKYFSKEECKLSTQQQSRQRSYLVNKDTIRGRSQEEKENQRSQQSSQSKTKQQQSNQSIKSQGNKLQQKPSLREINNNYLISQYFEQRVNKVINKFNYKVM